MSKVIVTGYTPNIAAEAEPFVQNQSEYAARWGYQYVVHTDKHAAAQSAHPSWSKVLFIRDLLLAGHELVVWADADLAFTNFARDIGELLTVDQWCAGLRELDKGVPKYLCCGLLVILNCASAVRCFDRLAGLVENGEHEDEKPWEQTPFNELTHSQPEMLAGVHACQPDEIGSFWHELIGQPTLRPWKYGDLTVHCGGAPWGVRAQIFWNKYRPKIVREALPVVKDGEEIQEPREALTDDTLKNVRLFVGVPCHGGTLSVICSTALEMLSTALFEAGVNHKIKKLNGEKIARARNRLADEFMDGSWTHFLFVDSDIGFRFNDVLDMIRANVHVVGGIYPMKAYNEERILASAQVDKDAEERGLAAGLDYVVTPTLKTVLDGTGNVRKAARIFRRCMEVNELGGGLLLISREAFQRWTDAYPEQTYSDDFPQTRDKLITAYFFEGIVEHRWLSEDYWFCHFWRKISGNVWSWPWAQLDHAGVHIFHGEFERRVRPSKEVVTPIAPEQTVNQGD